MAHVGYHPGRLHASVGMAELNCTVCWRSGYGLPVLHEQLNMTDRPRAGSSFRSSTADLLADLGLLFQFVNGQLLY